MTPPAAATATPRLVVLGASPTIAAIARRIDPRVVFVQQPGSPVVDLIDTETNLYSLDFTDERRFRSFVREVLRPLGPAAVVSVTETALRPAAVANSILGTPGTPVDVVERFNDKLLMRQRLADRLPKLSGRYAVPATGAEAAKVLGEWGVTRAVLKPRAGTASRGVRMVDGADRIDAAEDLSSLLLEEYLPGREYSAESFSRGGSHRVVAVTGKHVFDSTFVESAHVVPAPGLTPHERGVIEESVGAFLDAMGLADGPAHTEFTLADGEVRIIESHTRVGGDGIADLVRHATGVDLKRLALGWPVGATEDECTAPAQAPAAAVAFATALPGRVTKVSRPEPVGQDGTDVVSLTVSVEPGDTVGELTDSMKRVGRVMTTGDTPDGTLAAARALAARITVETRAQGEPWHVRSS